MITTITTISKETWQGGRNSFQIIVKKRSSYPPRCENWAVAGSGDKTLGTRLLITVVKSRQKSSKAVKNQINSVKKKKLFYNIESSVC